MYTYHSLEAKINSSMQKAIGKLEWKELGRIRLGVHVYKYNLCHTLLENIFL